MKRSRFTDQQIAYALKQAELGTPIPEVCRKMGIADATFYSGQVRTARSDEPDRGWRKPSGLPPIRSASPTSVRSKEQPPYPTVPTYRPADPSLLPFRASLRGSRRLDPEDRSGCGCGCGPILYPPLDPPIPSGDDLIRTPSFRIGTRSETCFLG